MRIAALLLIAIPVAAQETEGEVRIVRDLPYKTEGLDYEKERCKLDLYLPADRKGFPVVVWFHGGGLKGGDKAARAAIQVGQRLASAGIAVASANYRLSPKAGTR